MVPVPESKPAAAEYPKKRSRPDEDDAAWTSFEPTQKKDLKPIRAPTREAFDRFSAKSTNSKQNETLSQAGESEQSEGIGLLARFKRDKLKNLPDEPVSKAPEYSRQSKPVKKEPVKQAATKVNLPSEDSEYQIIPVADLGPKQDAKRGDSAVERSQRKHKSRSRPAKQFREGDRDRQNAHDLNPHQASAIKPSVSMQSSRKPSPSLREQVLMARAASKM